MADWMTDLEAEANRPTEEPTEAPVVETPPVQEDEQPEEVSVQTAPTEEGEVEGTIVEETAEPAQSPRTAKEPFIPKSRLDSEIEKRRKLEEDLRLAQDFIRRSMESPQQQQPQQPQKTVDEVLDDMYQQEYDALMDGDTAKALQLRRESDRIKMDQFARMAAYNAQTAVSGNTEQMVFNQRLEQTVQQYPMFVETSDQYDPELTKTALTIGESLKARGMNSVQALEETIKILQPVLQARMPAAPAPATPAPNRSNVQQKVAAARVQPPSTQSAGTTQRTPAKHDVMSMTIEDFESLPQDEINRMLRGA